MLYIILVSTAVVIVMMVCVIVSVIYICRKNHDSLNLLRHRDRQDTINLRTVLDLNQLYEGTRTSSEMSSSHISEEGIRNNGFTYQARKTTTQSKKKHGRRRSSTTNAPERYATDAECHEQMENRRSSHYSNGHISINNENNTNHSNRAHYMTRRSRSSGNLAVEMIPGNETLQQFNDASSTYQNSSQVPIYRTRLPVTPGVQDSPNSQNNDNLRVLAEKLHKHYMMHRMELQQEVEHKLECRDVADHYEIVSEPTNTYL